MKVRKNRKEKRKKRERCLIYWHMQMSLIWFEVDINQHQSTGWFYSVSSPLFFSHSRQKVRQLKRHQLKLWWRHSGSERKLLTWHFVEIRLGYACVKQTKKDEKIAHDKNGQTRLNFVQAKLRRIHHKNAREIDQRKKHLKTQLTNTESKNFPPFFYLENEENKNQDYQSVAFICGWSYSRSCRAPHLAVFFYRHHYSIVERTLLYVFLSF